MYFRILPLFVAECKHVRTNEQSQKFAVNFFVQNMRQAGAEKRNEKRVDAGYAKLLDIGTDPDTVALLAKIRLTYYMDHSMLRMYEQYETGKRRSFRNALL